MISLQNVSRIYSRKGVSENVIALNDISINFPITGFVSILGASGSGKTTLLNIIGGLDFATSGKMVVDGISTNEFKDVDWDSYRNEKIGFIFQNCYLLPHLSIKDNVLTKLDISNRKYKDASILADEALKEVDLYDRRNDKPKSLSGGQRQRVAIARAIIGKPTVILADEPTGALDSKTGKQIMEILKRLSKDHLVIMVTHNREYANEYSDRIIELEDGKIKSDTAPLSEKNELSTFKIGKVSISPLTSLKWGIKNLIIKKYSTISIILASSLGLTGVGLILSLSSGVKEAFVQTEEKALSRYPVTISSYSKQSSDGSATSYEEFTDAQEVYADLSDYATQEHLNYMSDEFLSYMGKMPKDYYYIDYDSSVTSFNIYTKVNESENTYKKVSSSNFYKGVDNEEFLKNEYDCLTGSYPKTAHELALVVDKYNRVDGRYLNSLGFDVDISHYSEIKLSFSDIVGKKYRYVTNDTYYRYNNTENKYEVDSKSYEEFYNSSTFELTIVGILREKVESGNPLFKTGILYSPSFKEQVISDSNSSQIVIDQKSFGLSKNVLTGEEFKPIQSGSLSYSAEYVYESALYNLGVYERVVTLYYFTDNFSSRTLISNYFDKYVSSDEVDFGTLTYNDYLEKVTVQFDGAINLMTSVLYVFAAVSVFVSAVLNAILTYISIHQRTGEIGLLRSLGARKKDIWFMVETESFISGLFGGIFSIVLSVILIPPLNNLLTIAIYKYRFYLLSSTTFTLSGFQWWVAPILIGLGLLTALVSALIPAIIASKKDPAHAINE